MRWGQYPRSPKKNASATQRGHSRRPLFWEPFSEQWRWAPRVAAWLLLALESSVPVPIQPCPSLGLSPWKDVFSYWNLRFSAIVKYI